MLGRHAASASSSYLNGCDGPRGRDGITTRRHSSVFAPRLALVTAFQAGFNNGGRVDRPTCTRAARRARSVVGSIAYLSRV